MPAVIFFDRILKMLVCCVLCFPLAISAQTRSDSLRKQIDRDIWIPFLQGINTNNADLYNSVHSKDFNWVAGGNKTRIMDLPSYVEDAAKVMTDRKNKRIQTIVDVAFLERNLNETFASEKCVTRYTAIEPGKEPLVMYGIAQVFSKKVDGVWKKFIQYVSTEKATRELFEQASPLEKS